MPKSCLVLLLAVALLPGCGGSGGSGGSSKTPAGTVKWFRASVDDGDWKAACARLSRLGKASVAARLVIFSADETDEFGELKNCSASLAKHSDLLRQKLERTAPGKTHKLAPNAATVSSPRGDWAVDTAEKTGEWRISALPTGN